MQDDMLDGKVWRATCRWPIKAADRDVVRRSKRCKMDNAPGQHQPTMVDRCDGTKRICSTMLVSTQWALQCGDVQNGSQTMVNGQ